MPEHIEREPDGDIKEIFFRQVERFRIDPPAEDGDQGVVKDEVQHRQKTPCPDGQQDSVPDGMSRFLFLPVPQQTADHGTASVTEADRDAERDHGQREHDGICRVAVGAEVACIGDKDLIDNVIQCPDQKGDDAGDGVFPHEPPHPFGGEEILCFFHGKCFLRKKIMRKSDRSDLRISATQLLFMITLSATESKGHFS